MMLMNMSITDGRKKTWSFIDFRVNIMLITWLSIYCHVPLQHPFNRAVQLTLCLVIKDRLANGKQRLLISSNAHMHKKFQYRLNMWNLTVCSRATIRRCNLSFLFSKLAAAISDMFLLFYSV